MNRHTVSLNLNTIKTVDLKGLTLIINSIII